MAKLIRFIIAKGADLFFGKLIVPLLGVGLGGLFALAYWPLWGPWWSCGMAATTMLVAGLFFGWWKYELTTGRTKRWSQARQYREDLRKEKEESRRIASEDEMKRILDNLDAEERRIVLSFKNKNTQGYDFTRPVIAGLLAKKVLVRRQCRGVGTLSDDVDATCKKTPRLGI